MMKRTALLPLAFLAIGAMVAPASASASADKRSCGTINLGGVRIFNKLNMRCENAKHYARRLYKTDGRDEPRSFSCSSGSNFNSGAFCEHDFKHKYFGWHPADKRKFGSQGSGRYKAVWKVFGGRLGKPLHFEVVEGPVRASGLAGARASCKPVVNPYEGTRYEGVDLTRIQADGVGCPKARRVARRAHKKALGLAPDPSGELDFRWNGWDVSGNLRPDHDRYRAERRDKRVRWRF